MFVPLGYKLAERRHHANQLLNFFLGLRWLQLFDGFHLLRVHVDSPE
jgi:hypothetical protein